MTHKLSEVPYDGLLFAKKLGKGGHELGRLARVWVDTRSRKSDFKNALASVGDATRFYEEVKEVNRPPADKPYVYNILRALNSQAIILYARGSDPGGERTKLPLNKWLFTDDERAKHRALLRVRSKVVAHHVQSMSDVAGPWLNETMVLEPTPDGFNFGIQLLRYNFKSDVTWDLMEMAAKAVERIEPLEDVAEAATRAELARILRVPANHDILRASRFDLEDVHKDPNSCETGCWARPTSVITRTRTRAIRLKPAASRIVDKSSMAGTPSAALALCRGRFSARHPTL